MNRTRYIIITSIIVSLLWGFSRFQAHSPTNWWAESTIFFWTLPIAVAILLYLQISKTSVTLIGIFLVLHVIGMHYNYGEVPFGETLGQWFGGERNQYDRLVHFAFGLLLFYPLREVLLRVRRTFGLFNYFIPLALVAAFSAVYEIMEWRSVSSMSSAAGYLFIGGSDPFDSQKDMLVAIIGGFLVLAIVLIADLVRNKGKISGMLPIACQNREAV
jgi:putative membrane protein